MTTSNTPSSPTASTSSTVAGEGDTDEGELIWVPVSFHVPDRDRGPAGEEKSGGTGRSGNVLQNRHPETGKGAGGATEDSSGPIPGNPKEWGPNPEQYLQAQHRVRRQYNSQGLESRTEYLTANGELFNTDVTEYGERGAVSKIIRLDTRGVRGTERRCNPDTTLSFDPSGEKAIALHGLLPKDLDLALRVGTGETGTRHRNCPRTRFSRPPGSPGRNWNQKPNLVFLTLRNQSDKEVKYQNSHQALLSLELKDKQGTVIPLDPTDRREGPGSTSRRLSLRGQPS